MPVLDPDPLYKSSLVYGATGKEPGVMNLECPILLLALNPMT
jgi:hypothetical protein